MRTSGERRPCPSNKGANSDRGEEKIKKEAGHGQPGVETTKKKIIALAREREEKLEPEGEENVAGL